MEKKIVENFLNDRYSKADYLEILRHFENETDFETLKKYMDEQWNTSGENDLSAEKLAVMRSKLYKKIVVAKSKEKRKITGRLVWMLQKAAAVLIIPALIISVYFFWQWKEATNNRGAFAEIYCPLGTRTKFNLPDGTSGWLNSGSTLKYPVDFRKNRDVELTGQAFFDVTKDAKHPFMVKTHLFNIQVLGTKFDVTAYHEDRLFEVVLESGEVKILSKYTKHVKQLVPNQRFEFDKVTRKAALVEVEPNYYTSWKEGKLVFRNTALSDVMARLGRWYNVDFQCEDPTLFEIPYRATFQEERLDHVMELLTMTAPISYEIIKSGKTDDDTYNKQKVIVRRKK